MPPRTKTLDEIAIEVGADKSSLYHNYTPVYEALFAAKRREPVRLLELGWGFPELPGGAGASAKVWTKYFPHKDSQFVFVDIDPYETDLERVWLYQGDQADPSLAADIADLHGPFDFIVDDASHVSSKTIASFETYFPHLVEGGVYVVEDIHSSYHAHYYGTRDADPNPENDDRTAMGHFKRMADQVNKDFFDEQYHWWYDLAEVRFARDQVIVIRS